MMAGEVLTSVACGAARTTVVRVKGGELVIHEIYAKNRDQTSAVVQFIENTLNSHVTIFLAFHRWYKSKIIHVTFLVLHVCFAIKCNALWQE